MQPCGTLILNIKAEEMWLSNLTDWSLLVGNPRVKLQSEVLMPRCVTISLDGTTMRSPQTAFRE